MKSGLVSVSFRKWSPEKIIRACADFGLTGIEWGGDIHVLPGEVALAEKIGKATRDAGCEVAAYGSYYRSVDHGESFQAVLDSALALQAPIIRVWAGDCGTADADSEKFATVVETLRHCGERAQAVGLRIGIEYHSHTLTDNLQSTLDLLKAIDHPAVGSLWQPPIGMTQPEAESELQSLLPWLTHLHVFNWSRAEDGKGIVRHPLAGGESVWQSYFALAESAKPSYALLEFILDDSEAQLREDAAVLNRMLGKI